MCEERELPPTERVNIFTTIQVTFLGFESSLRSFDDTNDFGVNEIRLKRLG